MLGWKYRITRKLNEWTYTHQFGWNDLLSMWAPSNCTQCRTHECTDAIRLAFVVALTLLIASNECMRACLLFLSALSVVAIVTDIELELPVVSRSLRSYIRPFQNAFIVCIQPFLNIFFELAALSFKSRVPLRASLSSLRNAMIAVCFWIPNVHLYIYFY